MKQVLLLTACIGIHLAFFCPVAAGGELPWKPMDFSPLVDLPWKRPGATLSRTLEVVFKEPDAGIRYPVLAEYFRTEIPLADLARAFEICLTLDGRQDATDLIALLLPIWAQREPETAWNKAQSLVGAVVLEGSPLDLDSWRGPTVKVVNRKAWVASKIWMEPRALAGLGVGISSAEMPVESRRRLLKEYASFYVDHFDALPEPGGAEGGGRGYPGANPRLIKTLELPAGEFSQEVSGNDPGEPAALQAGFNRWLAQEPKLGMKLLELQEELSEKAKSAVGSATPVRLPQPSFYLLWRQVDPAGLLSLALSEDPDLAEASERARVVMMADRPLTDEVTRRLAKRSVGANTSEEEEGDECRLLAWYDPQAAWQLALRLKDPDVLRDVADDMVYGNGNTANGFLHGIRAFAGLDLPAAAKVLGEAVFEQMLQEYGYMVMEQWLEVDVASAAKFGFHFLTAIPEVRAVAREDLLRLLRGDDQFASDGDMIDRTFCALRFWAMWKPAEMEAWIATVTQNDPEMNRVLSWLWENPWGPEAEHGN